MGATKTRCKYTYACDTNASATNATVSGRRGAATGNSTVGIFARGNGSSCRCKYTYSGCVNATATASSAISNVGAAASNGTTGVNV